MRFLYQLGSTWLHFGTKNLPKSRLGGVLGRLGASWRPLGAYWARLGASWAHLGASWRRLGASWARLEPSWTLFDLNYVKRGPASQLHLAAANQQISNGRKTYCRKTTYRKTTEDLCRDRVPLNADTQLGAFGPGADIE